MAGGARRHRRRHGRRHAAATARIVTAGLSSAAAFGLMTGMAVTGRAGETGDTSATAETVGLLPGTAPLLPGDRPDGTASPAPSSVILVIRRHWTAVSPTAAGAPAGMNAAPGAAPRQVTSPGTPAPAAVTAPVRLAPSRPVRRPVTRTRSS
jgi:hypothetical protein